MDTFDFDLDRIVSLIKEMNAKLIGLQFPEGLKRRAVEIARLLEEGTGAIALISGKPCYGACDIDIELADSVDLLFHFGHAPILDFNKKVVYIEARAGVDLLPVVKKALPLLRGERVAVITTVQHVHKLEEICFFLEEHGKKCILGKGDSRIKYPGQVLGCDFLAVRVDADEYLFIGSGSFHPLGVALASHRRVLAADPFTREVWEVNPDKILRQRFAIIAKSMNAKTFGIIISTKIGQRREDLGHRLRAMAKKHGLEAFLILMDLVTPEELTCFKVDAFVNTACPRIAIDEAARFSTPLLSPIEFEIVLGERKWEDMVFDEIREYEKEEPRNPP